MKVTVFHNIATDPQGRHLGWDSGYRPGHPLVPVFRYETDSTLGVMGIANEAYRLFNVGDDPTFGTPAAEAVQYRMLQNRSLSKGDVLLLHTDDGPTWLACASSGWDPIDPPAWLAHQARRSGTQPWNKDDELRDVVLDDRSDPEEGVTDPAAFDRARDEIAKQLGRAWGGDVNYVREDDGGIIVAVGDPSETAIRWRVRVEPVVQVDTVPASGGRRTEYQHTRYGWVPCEVLAQTDAGYTVDLGRSQPWCGVTYEVPAERIRFV